MSSDYYMLWMKLVYEWVNDECNLDLTCVATYQLVDVKFVPWYEAGPDMEYVANREIWKCWYKII